MIEFTLKKNNHKSDTIKTNIILQFMNDKTYDL